MRRFNWLAANGVFYFPDCQTTSMTLCPGSVVPKSPERYSLLNTEMRTRQKKDHSIVDSGEETEAGS